jgi:cell division protease FtsH
MGPSNASHPRPAGPDLATRDPGSQGQKPSGQGPSFWWLLIWLLFLWNAVAFFFPRGAAQHPIAYSTFIAQLEANNISSVHVTGDQITGIFKKPFAPRPTPAPRSSPSSQSAPGSPAPAQPFTDFETTFPAVVGDPGLVPLLRAHNVHIDVSAPATPWFMTLLVTWLPLLVFIGLFVWMIARAGANAGGGLFNFGKIKPKQYSAEQPTVTFKDVASVGSAKSELQEEVDFLREPNKYRELGARIPRGVLLVGPPGTGKTLLARAVAGEAGVPFFSLNASEFVEMFVGVGASRVRDLFAKAKEAAPAIIFIDELDAVGRRRGAGVGTVNDEREQTLNQLLGELDGFDERFDVIIIAATNRPDVLDPALLRPGRFDRQVTIGLPDRDAREAILRIHAAKIRLSPEVDLAGLAGRTIGFSGADLANLTNEAALAAARSKHSSVTDADFESAIDLIRLGAANPHLADPEERRVVAYHEAGHTVVAWLTPNADPVHKVTIVPHGQALGLTEQLPDGERHNLSVSYLKARLAVMLAGRASEQIVFSELTTGAEQDLVEATALARRMITRWGMGDLGPAAFKTDEEQPFLGYDITQGRDYSDVIAARIDENVLRLLDEAQDAARDSLKNAREHLDELAAELLKSETVEEDDLIRILGPRAGSRPQLVTAPSQSEKTSSRELAG